MEIVWDRLSAAEWQAGLAGTGTGAAFQQHAAWGEACRALGSRTFRAEIRESGRRIGLAQIVHRRIAGLLHAAVCTRGPVWTADAEPGERARALRALARTLPLPRLRGLFVTPEAGEDAARDLRSVGLVRVMTPAATALLDLGAGEAALRRGLHGKWRNRLVRAEAAGIAIGETAPRAPAALAWLLAAEAAQQRARRYAALPAPLVAHWAAAGGGLMLLVASGGGARLAAMLFLLHGTRATYHLGWAAPEGKALNAHNLLLWEAMVRLPRRGIATLDLGGLNTEDLAGIARFKLGTGARPLVLCGTWFAG